jgi:hypothetical protein
VELEISRSSEEDYLSRGVALKDDWELNEGNTTVTLGINYLDDIVKTPASGEFPKHSYDFFAGASQLLNKNTLVTASVTLGYNDGYLNDPYKSVQRTDLVELPDGEGGVIVVPVVNIYPENRPDTRFRQVFQLGARHYFDPLHAALDGSWRFSSDDFGIESHTFSLEWRQEIGSRLIVAPFIRHYQQSAFFVNSLDGIPDLTPSPTPDGNPPHYSADYRLSRFNAISGGLKLHWVINDTFTATAAYERYEMSGRGDASERSPDQAYIDADMWTFGISAEF